jgi:hypothetical protein
MQKKNLETLAPYTNRKSEFMLRNNSTSSFSQIGGGYGALDLYDNKFVPHIIDYNTGIIDVPKWPKEKNSFAKKSASLSGLASAMESGSRNNPMLVNQSYTLPSLPKNLIRFTQEEPTLH